MAKGSFGERLKREREMREVSLNELTKSTRISQRFLEALENEEWSKLPGGVFGRGFVRTIAGYLGLDEEALLGEYDLARGDLTRNALTKPEDRIPSTPVWIPALAVLAICAVLAGLFFAGRYAWHRYTARRDSLRTSALINPIDDTYTALPQSQTQGTTVSSAALSSKLVNTPAMHRPSIFRFPPPPRECEFLRPTSYRLMASFPLESTAISPRRNTSKLPLAIRRLCCWS